MSSGDSERAVQRSSTLLSLQDAAINTIVKNIGGYRDLIKKKISPPMRKVLFETVMARKREIGQDQVWAALPYLDQHRTTESFSTRDFASIFRLKGKKGEISGGCVSMEEFLQYLVEFVPNLRQLNIVDPRNPPYFSSPFKRLQLEPLATDLLLKMRNLTHVTIICVYIKFSEFVRVCRESENWQSIKAVTILVDIEPNSIKQFLTTLNSKLDHQEYNAKEYPREIGIFLKKTDVDETYRQAEVSLLNDLDDLFPSLRKLDISGFRIQGVDDTQSERTRLLRILSREGRTLKSLCLYDIRPELNITFNHIFKHCNDLESLELVTSSLGHDDPITSFGQLKSLKWRYTFNRDCIRLDRILSAPLLQEIFIVHCNFKLGDKDSLLNRIRNRKILTQLTSFLIRSFEEYDESLNEFATELRSLNVDVRLIRG